MVLQSDRCYCGRLKGLRMAFCQNDYYSLSHDMRQALYYKVGAGFEEAYETAKLWLEERKAIAAEGATKADA